MAPPDSDPYLTWDAGETVSVAQERLILSVAREVGGLSEAERGARLARLDPRLAAQVRSRLAGGGGEAGAVASTAGEDDERRDVPLLQPGSHVGPYRVVEPLGAGGMGCVYLAEQTEPIQRRVALKVLRFSLAGSAVRRRFAAERHAMGRLDHPNVGRILDAGVTPDGVPYLAMEWIDGTPLLDYCRQRDLPVRRRLELFAQVCRGVDHAHHKFLLHRDIKPSNVLVAEVDGRPVPKLIDFGVAEILDQVEGEAGRPPEVFGTPRYMSPEALGMGGDVDTRSDVFSLGVLLYEMLTGRRPWQGEEGSWQAMAQDRAGGEPPPPSSTVTRAAPGSGRRSGPPARELRGDLDAIVLRALAPDPEARYDSAGALGDDVERHLADLPVSARRGSGFYRLGKLLQRYRAAALAVLLVAAALLVGAVGTTLGLMRARDAEELARAEAAEAEQARAEAEEVSEFLAGLFAGTSPLDRDNTRPPSELTALELLERGAGRLEAGELADQPVTRARLEETVGSVYRQLGRYEDADRHLAAAVELMQGAEDAEPREVASVLVHRAELDITRADGEAAGRHLERALALLEGRHQRDDEQVRADVLGNLGRQRRLVAEYEEAEGYLRQAIALENELDGEESFGVASNRSNLGSLFFAQNRWADAEAEWRPALQVMRRVRGPDHARVATLSDNLGAALASQGKLDEAAPLFEESLRIRRHLLGDDHPRISDTYNNLGVLYSDLGDREKALAYHRRALAIRQRAYGPDHPTTAWSLDNLAHVLADAGEDVEARELQARALAIREAQYGGDHLEVARSLDHLADLALEDGDVGRAVELRRRVLAVRRAGLEPGHPLLAFSEVELGEAMWRSGDHEAARPLLDAGLAALEAAGDAGAEDLAEARERVAALEGV